MTRGAARDRLIVALDVPNRARALELVDRLEGSCQWFKVGMELFYAEGAGIVRELRAKGLDVFLDLKLYDIPNTVAGAVRSVEDLGASLLTLHAGGGLPMLQAAREALGCSQLRLLAVTVLTSMDAEQLRATGVEGSPSEHVLQLARLAAAAGMDGVVCSAEEVTAVRQVVGGSAEIVAPGIRPAGAAPGDQRRIATPASALRAGASMLVVGRPILAANDPRAAAEAILADMNDVLVNAPAQVA